MTNKLLITCGLLIAVGASHVGAASSSMYDAAQYLAEKGIINKYELGDSQYELDRPVLRQEAVAIAREMAGIPKKEVCEEKFIDITEKWVCLNAEAMLDEGRIAANILFNPRLILTKPEALAMAITSSCDISYTLYKENHPEYIVSDFSDLNIGTWTMLENFAKENNLMTDAYLRDQKGDLKDFLSATRGEMFEMAEKVMKGCGEGMTKEIIHDLGYGFIVKQKGLGDFQLFYKEKLLDTLENKYVTNSHGYVYNSDMSTNEVKIFYKNPPMGGEILYNLESNTYIILDDVINKIEIGEFGTYILSYGSNGISNLYLLSNLGEKNLLYSGNPDAGLETTMITNFELLSGGRVKVTYSDFSHLNLTDQGYVPNEPNYKNVIIPIQ